MFPIFRSKSVENSRCTQDVDVSMDVDPGSSLGNHFNFLKSLFKLLCLWVFDFDFTYKITQRSRQH